MARVLGVNISTCTYNSITLLPDLKDITCGISTDTVDTTVLGGGGWKTFLATLKFGDDIVLNMIFNNQSAASEGLKLFATNLGVAQTFAWNDGTLTFSCSTILTKVPVDIKVADLIMMPSVTLKPTSTVTIS